MPGRPNALGTPIRWAETTKRAAAGPAATTVQVGVDPAAAADVGLALRVPAFVIVTMALTLGAHLAAGGGSPSPGSALLVGVLLGIAGQLFALREHSLVRLTALVWSVQAGCHFVLMAGHQHGAHLLAVRFGGHHLHLATQLGTAPSPRAAQASDLAGQAAGGAASATEFGSPLMMLALHAIAGLLVAAWLRRGEAAVFRAARRILPRMLAHRAAPPVGSSTPRSVVPVCTAPRRLKGELFIRLATPHRGPPLLPA
jgi:hypothetical protein